MTAGEKSSTPAAAASATTPAAAAAVSTTPADPSTGKSQKYGFRVQKAKKGLAYSFIVLSLCFLSL